MNKFATIFGVMLGGTTLNRHRLSRLNEDKAAVSDEKISMDGMSIECRARMRDRAERRRTVEWENHRGEKRSGKVIKYNALTVMVCIDGRAVKIRRSDITNIADWGDE